MDALATAQKVINEQINPLLAAHGGSIEVVDFKDGVLFISMKGGCQGCAMAKATMRNFVKRNLQAQIPCILDVQDVTNHKAGTNPYFKGDT